MVAAKGKQGTKGQKQIVEENRETLKFYLWMSIACSVLHFSVCYFMFFESTSNLSWVCFAVSSVLQVASVQFMRYMSKAQYGTTGQLLDAGLDINMSGGVAEYCKDLVILCAGLQLLSLLSIYCWILFLACPIYVVYVTWSSIISPWLSTPVEGADADDKKRRKKERKLVKVN